jgi:hypothetical protein
VLLAVGRNANTSLLNLKKIGIDINPFNNKVTKLKIKILNKINFK